jgi:hypothetical protein
VISLDKTSSSIKCHKITLECKREKEGIEMTLLELKTVKMGITGAKQVQ